MEVHKPLCGASHDRGIELLVEQDTQSQVELDLRQVLSQVSRGDDGDLVLLGDMLDPLVVAVAFGTTATIRCPLMASSRLRQR